MSAEDLDVAGVVLDYESIVRSREIDPSRAPLPLEEFALTIVDQIDTMLGYWDSRLICRFVSKSYGTWFGKTREQLIGMTMEDVIGPLFALNRAYIAGALLGKEQQFERDITLPDGTIRHALARYYPHVVDGVVRGFVAYTTDITILKNLERELQAAKAGAEFRASHDSLTGLPNRLLLVERIAAAIRDAAASNGSFAVASLDLDDFKTVNDRYGHAAGDELLVEVAKRIRTTLHPADIATRIGGDEFVLLVTATGDRTFDTIARELLDAVGAGLVTDGVHIAPTCSIGIATYPVHGTTPKALLLRSDRALYVAKARGKNRVAIAD